MMSDADGHLDRMLMILSKCCALPCENCFSGSLVYFSVTTPQYIICRDAEQTQLELEGALCRKKKEPLTLTCNKLFHIKAITISRLKQTLFFNTSEQFLYINGDNKLFLPLMFKKKL